jgi:formate dehydrogenase
MDSTLGDTARGGLAPSASDERTVYTYCRYCIANCGVEVTVANNKVLKIKPDKQNPHTWADFCAKGRTANELVEHPRRITTPLRRVDDRYVEATWEEAISDIAARMNEAIERGGPDSVGAYWGNPAGFCTSNVMFMGAFLDAIGTMNRYYVGSVDQNNFHVVAEAMYGSQLMAPVSDIDNCDYFLLVGANPAVSAWNWLESVPGGWKRALNRQRLGATIVAVDPVRSETAAKADVHLAVRPGQDWALLLAMVKVIVDNGLEHTEDCRTLTNGFPELKRLVAEADLDDLAARCDIPRADIENIARGFANAPRAMVVTRTGVSLHQGGTIAEWLGNVLNVITGRMDRPGGRRFEPGYLNVIKLFDLMVKPMTHRSRVQNREMVAGHHAIDELPGEITTPGKGQIRAFIINAGNPVVSGPNGAKLDQALSELDLLVVIDFVQRESHRHAHWLLPAVHWLERDDIAGGQHDEPYVHFGPRAVEAPAGARQEWRILTDLAIAMKKPIFGSKAFNGFIKATRRLAAATGRGSLEFSPHWIDRMLILSGRKVKWRDIVAHPHGLVFGKREFGHFKKALRTKDGLVHVAPEKFLSRTRSLLAEAQPAAPSEFPFLMTSRRHRQSMNSWLNELPGLNPARKGNQVVMHPADADQLGISDGELVRVFSAVGEIELPLQISPLPRRGVVIVDYGWGSRIFDPSGGRTPESYGANRNLLIDGAKLDPLSQTPALSSSYVGIRRAAERKAGLTAAPSMAEASG